jgi:hypothetical protein
MNCGRMCTQSRKRKKFSKSRNRDAPGLVLCVTVVKLTGKLNLFIIVAFVEVFTILGDFVELVASRLATVIASL